MLDTWGPGYPHVRPGAWIRHLPLLLVRALLPVGRKDDLSWRNLSAGVREWAARIRANLAMRGERSVVPPYPWRIIYLQEVCFRARRRYRAERYPGRIDLFRAETQPPALLYDQERDLRWSTLAADLVVHDMHGDHGTYLQGEAVVVLAGRLDGLLRNCLGADMPTGR